MTDTLAPTDPADLLMWCTACPSEAAAEIERLTRERDQWEARAVGLFWLIPDGMASELRLADVRGSAERASRALAAESSLSEAEKALQYGLDAVHESFDYAHSADDHLLAESRYRAIEDALSTIRARGAVLGSDKM